MVPSPAKAEPISRLRLPHGPFQGAVRAVAKFFSSLLEWKLFKTVQFDEGAVPNKYRELIGVGIAAITKCEYCIQYHTEVAKLNGATEAELEDAVHFAKSSAGWSAYLNGMQVDEAEFADELAQVATYVRNHTLAAAAD